MKRPRSFGKHTYPWERACSRRGQRTQHSCRMRNRFREQARSHMGHVQLVGRANPGQPTPDK
ncbi:hypothetical protein DMX03_00665 [Pseudomonas koreensis]|nr:hypothetical protein DMX03_00665 [Pseudomonas koreensis]